MSKINKTIFVTSIQCEKKYSITDLKNFAILVITYC